MTLCSQKARALAVLCDAIVETIAECSTGAPGGTLYAALMSHGCSYEQFEQIMSALVATRRVEKRGQLYFARKMS